MGSSSEVSAYIDLYTSRDPIPASATLGENAKPTPVPYSDKTHPQVPVFRSGSPHPKLYRGAQLRGDAIGDPLPLFNQLSRLPSPIEATNQHAAGLKNIDNPSTAALSHSTTASTSSSSYPSEGIRSEDCISPPGEPLSPLAGAEEAEEAGTNPQDPVHARGSVRHHAFNPSDFNLSDDWQHWPSRSATRSCLRSTSLTDAAGPHERNVSTNLLDELVAADGSPEVGMEEDGADSSSSGILVKGEKDLVVTVSHAKLHEDGEGSNSSLDSLSHTATDGDGISSATPRDEGNEAVAEVPGLGGRVAVSGKSGDRIKKKRRFRVGKWVRRAIKKNSGFFRKGFLELIRDKRRKKSSEKP